VVFTSATLSTGGTFDYVSREFGLRPSDVQHAVILPPVFDYKSRSCLYVSDKTAPYGRDTKADYWRTCTSAMDEPSRPSGRRARAVRLLRRHDGLL
jgi:Rad3-related DNA helicase